MCNNYKKKIAAHKGNTECVQLLCLFGADASKIENRMGQTPLHLACMGGCTEVVHVLVNAVDDITGLDKDGCNAYQIAALRGHKEICEVL